MNADAYLMANRLPAMAASKYQALHELTTALSSLKAAERSGNDTEIERGQWRVIEAASNLCQVTGGNIVELGNLLTAGLASYNTAVTNMATVIDIHTALAHTLDNPPRNRTAATTMLNSSPSLQGALARVVHQLPPLGWFRLPGGGPG